MAHLRPLPFCQHEGCPSSASLSLHNNRNAHMGDFCERHAKTHLAELTSREFTDG